MSWFGDNHLDTWAMMTCPFLVELTTALGLGSVRQLQAYSRDNRTYEEVAVVTEVEALFFREFATRTGVLCPANITVAPSNSIPASLLWMVLGAILV